MRPPAWTSTPRPSRNGGARWRASSPSGCSGPAPTPGTGPARTRWPRSASRPTLGFAGLFAPVADGGQGVDGLIGSLILEQLARGCFATTLSGLRRDRPVERYLRWAKVTAFIDGTPQVQQLVIARDLLR